MCQAVPREVVGVKKDKVFVDIEGRETVAKSLEPDLREGDFVLLMGDLVVRKLTKEEAREIINAREGK